MDDGSDPDEDGEDCQDLGGVCDCCERRVSRIYLTERHWAHAWLCDECYGGALAEDEGDDIGGEGCDGDAD